MYQIEGREVLFDWLRREQDANRRLMFLEWLIDVASDPWRVAHRIPAIAAPVCLRIAPVKPPAVVKLLIADQFRTVKLIDISDFR